MPDSLKSVRLPLSVYICEMSSSIFVHMASGWAVEAKQSTIANEVHVHNVRNICGMLHILTCLSALSDVYFWIPFDFEDDVVNFCRS